MSSKKLYMKERNKMNTNYVKIQGEIIKIIDKKKDKDIFKCNIKVSDGENKFSIFRVFASGEKAKTFYENLVTGDEILIEGHLRSSRFIYKDEVTYAIEIVADEIKNI